MSRGEDCRDVIDTSRYTRCAAECTGKDDAAATFRAEQEQEQWRVAAAQVHKNQARKDKRERRWLPFVMHNDQDQRSSCLTVHQGREEIRPFSRSSEELRHDAIPGTSQSPNSHYLLPIRAPAAAGTVCRLLLGALCST